MEPRPDIPNNPKPPAALPLCRIEVLQAALNGFIPTEQRLESMLDRIEVTS